MNKLQSFTFYALVAPVISLGAGSLLAEESTGQNMDRQQQSTQREEGVKQGAQSTPRAEQHNSKAAADRRNASSQNRGFMDSTPANGMRASNLIGTEVKTSKDEDVGSVSDLIINDNGQLMAIVVSVGGFLGMGERDVAIGWDDVTQSGVADEPHLRIKATLDSLRAAPEFEARN
ncbi:PRC-barrel domain-containing protein [Parahaliea aestuarii]|uniref:PRC-barrel domain containing protein n=1 Tax=Parahaliea aestuarii TaxID=1852021 RepID=A0A5C8ZV04_9GAMM|nr:PRC-barrel domain-containing protein [Parahaliea aestuarii]TXS91649.1 PRC-barrel domain containing protein [Parahaliea aestuarii]